MSKAKKLSYDDIISGAKLGVDSIGQDVKHGDTVMYCDDRRGREAEVQSCLGELFARCEVITLLQIWM